VRGLESLLMLPGAGLVSNLQEGVLRQPDGREYMTSPVADHCSECGHNCHVVKDCEHSVAWTAVATIGEQPRTVDTGRSG